MAGIDDLKQELAMAQAHMRKSFVESIGPGNGPALDLHSKAAAEYAAVAAELRRMIADMGGRI